MEAMVHFQNREAEANIVKQRLLHPCVDLSAALSAARPMDLEAMAWTEDVVVEEVLILVVKTQRQRCTAVWQSTAATQIKRIALVEDDVFFILMPTASGVVVVARRPRQTLTLFRHRQAWRTVVAEVVDAVDAAP
jgi:hypothetical protein